MKKLYAYIILGLLFTACSQNKNIKKIVPKKPDVQTYDVPKANPHKAYPPAKKTEFKNLPKKNKIKKIDDEIILLNKTIVNLNKKLSLQHKNINRNGITEEDLIKIEAKISKIKQEIQDLKRLKVFLSTDLTEKKNE